MKINNRILSIPPHISTNWGNINSIVTKGPLLVIHLQDGRTVDIPGLEPTVIEVIFATHANFLEQTSNNPMPIKMLPFPQGGSSPLLPQVEGVRFNLGPVEEFGSSVFQHNQEQSQTPEIPIEILSKILAITKIISPTEQLLPKAEPHCNCVHCQLSRAAHQEPTQQEAGIAIGITQVPASQQDETVSDADLNFQQWEIVQAGEKLFSVTNRLDKQERYSVYLGDPVGCTCGKPGCEHTLAVLRS